MTDQFPPQTPDPSDSSQQGGYFPPYVPPGQPQPQPGGYFPPPPGYGPPQQGYGPPGYGPPPGQQWQQPPPGQFVPTGPMPPRKKRSGARIGCLSVLGVFVLIVIIGAIAAALGGSKGTSNNSGSGSSSGSSLSSQSPAAVVQSSAPPAATTPAGPQYTVSQQSAITAAEQYLSLGSGFSKEGLIQQLDSSSGSGFSYADALFAVNHITVNWFQQAALAAKGYMQLGGFSYSSMVQQLESSSGSGFTYAQAVYGAKSVGL